MPNHIAALLKITDFPDDVVNGNLYCRQLKYYMESDKDEIGDYFEGTGSIRIYETIIARYALRIIFEDLLSNPIFSMNAYLVNKKKDKYLIKFSDVRLKKFGKEVVIITNVNQFINLLHQNQPLFTSELVRYIDFTNLTGIDEFSIFNPVATKHNSFMHHNEFRIHSPKVSLTKGFEDDDIPDYCLKIDNDAYKFPIGDLQNITKVFPIDQLYSGIEISLDINWKETITKQFITKLPTL